MSICAGFMFLNALLALILRTYLVWLNKKAELAESETRSHIELRLMQGREISSQLRMKGLVIDIFYDRMKA